MTSTLDPTRSDSEDEVLRFRPYFTKGDPYDGVEWEIRDAAIPDFKRGGFAFEQKGVEFPKDWSQMATNIVSQKYFRTVDGVRERSLRQVFDRIADSITAWGDRDGYFATDEDREAFRNDLKYLMLHQMMAFNSPVWFNIGVKGAKQQSSACFILSVDDSMSSILNWITEEGMIFKRGSGAGTNLSRLRSSSETLTTGGVASGPVSFMRGADASAGTIKSGGATRRAAKLVCLDADHPDIEEFIWCKALEERKGRVLRDAGFDMGVDGKDIISLQYQNANNSVQVSDDFMRAVEKDGEWHLRDRSGEITKTVQARGLMHQIAEAAWECADPGLQYSDTINRWHCSPHSGRINASNPCSEHVNLDNSSCNLASLNLLKFLKDDGSFKTDDFMRAVRVTFTAQDILINGSDFPTDEIGEVTRNHRMLGLGYTNLGAALMCQGKPYDSDDGRAWAGAVTAIMTGTAYLQSTEMALKLGAYTQYEKNKAENIAVLRMHRDSVQGNNRVGLWEQAKTIWDTVVSQALAVGVRNNQATLLAPTGTISFAMDADTTGIEPDFSLVKSKTLVGGGTLTIVNEAVPRALSHLRYSPEVAASIVDHIAKTGTIVGSALKSEHEQVFACAVGEPVIDYMGHVKMMAAVQPYLSAAISKTVNMPTDCTVGDIEKLYIDAWKAGVKCLAIYRDGSKVGQPLETGGTDKLEAKVEEFGATGVVLPAEPAREPLPSRRRSQTTSFEIGECHGYLTVGEYDDGRPGEIFLKIAKQGSTLAGLMDAFAISVSHCLQYGVPLDALVKKYVNMKFEPFGMTDDPDIRITTSICDYVFRRLAVDYMDPRERAEIGIKTVAERTQALQMLPTEGEEEVLRETETVTLIEKPRTARDLPICYGCGGQMAPSGSCYVCPNCGSTSGCS